MLDVADYFTDRRKERETLSQLLSMSSTRCVSVIGRGGIGKTALVSRIMSGLENNEWFHTDETIPVSGIVYLSTRTAGISLERIFLSCAELFGSEKGDQIGNLWISQSTTSDKVSRLLKYFMDGLYIILLDNMEDLLDETGQLNDKDLQSS